MNCTNRRTDCTHGNPIVGIRARELEHRLHLERLKTVTASIDNAKPFMGNTEQQQKRPRKSYQVRSKEKMQAHDNFKMLTTIANTMNRPYRLPPKPVAPRSLNIGLRRKEHWKIVKENQQFLERLEKSKPLVATVEQYRREFAEHERRLMLCSYTCRRNAAKDKSFHQKTSRPERHNASRNGTSTHRAEEQVLRQKLAAKCYKNRDGPHASVVQPGSRPPHPARSPQPRQKQFDKRYKEFKCYPTSKQMWAPPKVFVPSDLPKPISVSA